VRNRFKVTLYIFAPDRYMHKKKVSVTSNGFCTVEIKSVKYCYLVPMDVYAKGQREFYYSLEDAQPLDLVALTQVPRSAILPLTAAQLSLSMVSRDRRGRLEMLFGLSNVHPTTVFSVTGRISEPADPDEVIIKMPEVGFMYKGSLSDLASAVEAVESGNIEKVDSE
jgi:hypothetical protein